MSYSCQDLGPSDFEALAADSLAQRSEGNFKVLLTTRDYILEQAVARMDSSSRTLGALKRSAITLGSFNLKVRGEILYSYLVASDLPRSVLREFHELKQLREEIIDHENFNPRRVLRRLHFLRE